VSWTGGESTLPRSTHGRASAPWLRGYARARRATPGSRRRAFGRVSSAGGAGGVRLCRRAPGVASRLEQRRATTEQWHNGDGMPRRTVADATAQGGRRTCGPPCGAGW
jgi:hypothetical protein